MNTPDRATAAAMIEQPGTKLWPALLAVILAALLFTLPAPVVRTTQPYRIELLLSLFIGAMLIIRQRRCRRPKAVTGGESGIIRCILISMAAFVIWSAASMLWAASLGSVAHHTMLWVIYLFFFLVFTDVTQTTRGIRQVTATFVWVSLILGVSCLFDYVTMTDFASVEADIRIRYGKYAELLVTLSPVLWAVAIYVKDTKIKWLVGIAGIMAWTTAMLSLSKGAFISGIAGFAVFFIGAALFSPRVFRRRVIVSAAIWLIFTTGFQAFFSLFSPVPATTDFITGKVDPTRSTALMRVFTWKVGRQMAADNWLKGVGADNFGLMFNRSRVTNREKNPDDPKDEIAEDYLVERAHNEPLQVATELGLPGILLFALPFLIFATYFCRRSLSTGFRVSPILWASAAGMTAFLISSQFSSFSFRSAQNGVVFFMVFALGVNELARSRSRKATVAALSILSRWVSIAGAVLATLFAVFCLTKAYAEFEVYRAERSPDYADARGHYRAAMTVDPEYGGAYYSYSIRANAENDPRSAAQLTRKAIDLGLGMTLTYSQLAKQQNAAGDATAADAVYREGLKVFPRSAYLRMEYAVFIEIQGKPDEAAKQAAMARSVDLRQANGWYAIIKRGSVAAYYEAQGNGDIAPPADLLPATAVRQYIDKVPGM